MKLLLALATLLLLAPVAGARVDRLDRDFAGRGWRHFDVATGDAGASKVLRTRRGKFLMAGFSYRSLAFVRMHPSGRFDRRFNRDGLATVQVPDALEPSEMLETAGGRVLVSYALFNQDEVGVLRLGADGRLDRGYGTRGQVRVPLPGAPAPARFVGMVPQGSGVMLVRQVTVADRPHVAVVRLDAGGRQVGEAQVHDLGGVPAAAVRTSGGIVVAVLRGTDSTLLRLAEDGTVLAAPRLELPGLLVPRLRRDRTGVAALVQASGRWGVRRYTASLIPRQAPERLPSVGFPSAFDMDSRGRAWVGFDDGRLSRLRPDGALDRRFAAPLTRTVDISHRHRLSTEDLITLPRGGAVAVGTLAGSYDIREDYELSEMWIGRFS